MQIPEQLQMLLAQVNCACSTQPVKCTSMFWELELNAASCVEPLARRKVPVNEPLPAVIHAFANTFAKLLNC